MELQFTTFRKALIALLAVVQLLLGVQIGWFLVLKGHWDRAIFGGLLIGLILPFVLHLKKRYIIAKEGIRSFGASQCFAWADIDHIVVEWSQKKLFSRSVLYLYHQKKTIDIGSVGYHNFSECALLILEEAAKRKIPVSFGSKMASTEASEVQAYKDWLRQFRREIS